MARGSIGKLSPEDVRMLRSVFDGRKASGDRKSRWRKPYAQRLGISPKYVGDICAGRTYRDIE